MQVPTKPPPFSFSLGSALIVMMIVGSILVISVAILDVLGLPRSDVVFAIILFVGVPILLRLGGQSNLEVEAKLYEGMTNNVSVASSTPDDKTVN